MKKILFILSLYVCCNVSAQTLKERAESGDKIAQYEYAYKLLTRYKSAPLEDVESAVYWYRKSAEQGYAPAQCNLGYCYGRGQGVRQSYDQALFWYKKSAEQDNATAQYNLGIYYSNGWGVPKSEQNAFIWYKKAAEQGYADAETALAKCHYYGKGTYKNYQLAFEWFTKAANKDNEAAQYYMGECYAYGYGVPKNMQKAIEWYKKSADNYNADAEYKLALLYLEGNGVEKDSITAAEWLLNSACGGFCNSSRMLYDKQNANDKAQKKLLELSNLTNSPNLHYFLAITGCFYDAMQEYTKAEVYYKRAIEKGSYLGTIELGLMYFYIAANTPQLYKYYHALDSENDDREYGELESYVYEDNTACLEYIKTKQWTEYDNVAYWLEKAISYGFGTFEYGAMPYDLYDHLYFVYVDGVGNIEVTEKTIDAVYICLTDSMYDDERFERSGLGYEMDGILNLVSEKTELSFKLFNMYKNLYETTNNQVAPKKDARRIASAGLGKCYYKGFGVSKDYPKAFNYLSEAVNLDDCESMRLLAACYGYGRGTQANAKKEKELLERAVKCGDEKARRLEELKKQGNGK